MLNGIPPTTSVPVVVTVAGTMLVKTPQTTKVRARFWVTINWTICPETTTNWTHRFVPTTMGPPCTVAPAINGTTVPFMVIDVVVNALTRPHSTNGPFTTGGGPTAPTVTTVWFEVACAVFVPCAVA